MWTPHEGGRLARETNTNCALTAREWFTDLFGTIQLPTNLMQHSPLLFFFLKLFSRHCRAVDFQLLSESNGIQGHDARFFILRRAIDRVNASFSSQLFFVYDFVSCLCIGTVIIPGGC